MAPKTTIPSGSSTTQTELPNPFTTAVKYGIRAAFAALICCVAPVVLVLFGLMGGIAALSFTGWFYNDDGSASWAGWLLRALAVGIGVLGVVLYRRKQNQCSIDKRRKRKNLVVLTLTLVVIGIAAFMALDRASTLAFESYITPMQQREFIARELERARDAHAKRDTRAVQLHLSEAENYVTKAAGFTTKRGTALFDEKGLAELRAPIDETKTELLPGSGQAPKPR